MVLAQLPASVMEQLYTLLEQMNICAKELELITEEEYKAIRALDADQIIAQTDRRALAHQALAQLEQQCRDLLRQHHISDDISLEVIIDMNAGERSEDLQSLRRNLYERMVRVDQRSQENHMRMHAAYNVSTNILQQLGLSQPEQTYSRR